MKAMKIEFDLIGNARDSLDRALELVAWGDQQHEARRLKQSVQTITHAIELLLKERLRRIHPCLLWEQVERYPAISARTVTTETAIVRLQNIGGLVFRERDLVLLRSLRATRNAIEHFSWTTTKPEADAVIGRALEFAFHFAKSELSIDYLDYAAHKDGTYADLVASNGHFHAAAESRGKEEAEPPEAALGSCSHCRGRAVNLQTLECRLCGFRELKPFNDLDDDIPF